MPHCMLRVVALALSLVATSSEVVRPLAAQDGAEELSERAPRFLAALTPKPILVDVARMPVLQRRIALDLRGATLAEALQTIGDLSGLRIAYSRVELPVERPVRLQARDITVAAALTEVLLGLGVDAVFNKRGQAMLVRRDREGRVRESGALVGRVTDASTGAGVALAEIFLSETKHRATSDTTGRFRLAGVDTGVYTLTARRLGYRKESRRVVVRDGGEDTVDVTLTPTAVTLNELVTTATGQQRRRDIGNAITTIKADSVLRTAPIRNLTDLLANRVPGLTVQHTSGAPGDPARLRLRGLGSIQRSNDPVVVVDGVRMYATQSEARSGNLTNAFRDPVSGDRLAAAPSPLDQIDPNIIETIEVFKGPSAATLYGADAANGVIVITTKRGKPGPTRWSALFEGGRTSTLGRYPTGYYRWGHHPFYGFELFCPITQPCVQDSLVQLQALNLPSLTVLGQGHRTALSLTASGGTQGLTYSVTGSYGTELGLLQLPAFEVERFRTTFNREAPDWMRRPHALTTWSVTSNVRALLGSVADVTLSSTLSRTEQRRSSLENQLSTLAGTYVDSVNKVYYRAGSPFGGPGVTASTAILQDYYVRTTASSISFTTGLSAGWRPLSWLNASGQAGVNIIPRDDQRLLPAGLASLVDSGHVSRATGQSLVSTFNVQSTIRRPLRWGFVFETSLGANLKTEHTADVGADASGLVPGTSTLSGATGIHAFDAQASSSVFGWYLEPRLTGQRLSLSTGLRLDGGSAYGTRISGLGGGLLGGLLPLPKLNGSWVISEESWFPFKSLFSSLRLRGAYGQAQVQPGPQDRLRLYRYSMLADPSVRLTTLGNTQLRPERSTEVEGGFDADLLDSRVSLEFTTYRKTQVDALLPVNLPESVNGGGSVLTNIGTIRNTGIEAVLRLVPVRSPALTWSNELGYISNRNELVELGRGVQANRGTGLVAGYPVGGRWTRPIIAYRDQNGDSVLQPDEVVLGDSAVFMGRIYPAYQLTFHSGITFLNGAVALSAGLSYDAGATQVNQTAAESWVLSRALVDPTTPLRQQAAVLTSVWSNSHTDYGIIQDVATFRFNSLAVNYRVPRTLTRLVRAQQLTIALQGSNLALHSTYRGKDPDVNAWSPGESIVDSGQLPQPTTWQLRVDVQY